MRGVPAEIGAALSAHGLAVVGGFLPGPEDGAPEGCETLLLIGADGPALWEAFRAAPEAGDGARDPLDRWSRRVIGEIARGCGADALFPFGGPPWRPFIAWAARAEGARPSPVGMLASPRRGLSASYRGALALRERLVLEPPAAHPCPSCPAPCRTACPVGAVSGGVYDVAACVAHVSSPEGAACRNGCLVRLACPVGALPPEAQRRFHMAAFLAAQRPIEPNPSRSC